MLALFPIHNAYQLSACMAFCMLIFSRNIATGYQIQSQKENPWRGMPPDHKAHALHFAMQ